MVYGQCLFIAGSGSVATLGSSIGLNLMQDLVSILDPSQEVKSDILSFFPDPLSSLNLTCQK